MYTMNLQPGQTYTIATYDGVLRAVAAGGRPSVNIRTGLEFRPGPLVEITLVPDPGNERRETCHLCGETHPVSVLARTTENYYDWDDPDEDREGSVLLSGEVWPCRDTHRCTEIRKARTAAWYDAAINADAAEYSRGIGQGWAVQP